MAEARLLLAESAPELVEQLVAIATDRRHPKQLEAIRLGLAYAVGEPTRRIEAEIRPAPLAVDAVAALTEALKDATARRGPRIEPRLLSGAEAVPSPVEIAAIVSELAGAAPERG